MRFRHTYKLILSLLQLVHVTFTAFTCSLKHGQPAIRLPYMETFFLSLLSIFNLRRTTTRPACDKVLLVEISGVAVLSRGIGSCGVADCGTYGVWES